MKNTNAELPQKASIGAVLAHATRSAGRGNDLAIVAGQIVAQRVALGMKGALNPAQADHDEFARMVPEKVEAFSAANMIMLRQSSEANQQVMRFASEEVRAGARAAIEMLGCASPTALMAAQANFLRAWANRATANFISIGTLILTSQDAVLAPIRDTVASNAERLS